MSARTSNTGCLGVRVPYVYTVFWLMRFAVRFLRHRGRILPWRDVANSQPRIGDLRIEQCLDTSLNRSVRTATLYDAESTVYSKDWATLLDVRLMGRSPQAFSLTGFERVAGVEYAQSWHVANCDRSTSR